MTDKIEHKNIGKIIKKKDIPLIIYIFIVFYTTIYFMGYPELVGIYVNLKPYAPLFLLLILSAIIAIVGIIIKKKEKRNNFTFMLNMAFILASVFLLTGLILHLNRISDTSKPFMVKVHITDVVKIERETFGEDYYIATDAPKEIDKYRILSIRNEDFSDSYLGKEYSVTGHSGVFGIQWFELNDLAKVGFYAENDLPLYYKGKKILKAEGYFSDNSFWKKQFEEWNVPVTELDKSQSP